jgi:outer membrane lipoprotein LolB
MSVFGRWLLVLVLLLQAACSIPVRPVAPMEWVLSAPPQVWTAQGRVAVRSINEGFSASFRWHETPAEGQIEVRGAFGAGATRIVRHDDLIVLENASGQPLEVAPPYASLDAALEARLGFALPVASLRYWVMGVPAPGRQVEGTASEFQQDGWHVTSSLYSVVPGASGSLPTRIELTRAGTRVRLLIDSWQVGVP